MITQKRSDKGINEIRGTFYDEGRGDDSPISPCRWRLLGAIVIAVILILAAILASSYFGASRTGTGTSTGDIAIGPITVNASRYNLYQFGIPYGAQDVNVHVQWSSGGSISIYIVNATELISWQSGHGLHSFYSSSQAANGDVTLHVPADDLYYLVFDNTFSPIQRNVQTTSGFSYMCSLCSSSAPIQQLNSSSPSCVGSNGNKVCSVVLSNMGKVQTSPTGVCIESWSPDEGPALTWGAPHLGVFSPTTPIPSSSNLTGTCTVAGTKAPLGLAISVLIPFTDGYNVVMYGPASLDSPICTQSGSRLVCSFSIDNEFTPGVLATECQIWVGTNTTGTVGGTTQFNADTRGALFTCSIPGTEPPVGTSVSGIVRFSNGSYALFSGRWS